MVFFCYIIYSITVLGTGAKWLAALEENKIHPSKLLYLIIDICLF